MGRDPNKPVTVESVAVSGALSQSTKLIKLSHAVRIQFVSKASSPYIGVGPKITSARDMSYSSSESYRWTLI